MCSIPTGPTHGEGRLQPTPGDVLKSTPNVRKSPRSGLNLERRLSDPQVYYCSISRTNTGHYTPASESELQPWLQKTLILQYRFYTNHFTIVTSLIRVEHTLSYYEINSPSFEFVQVLPFTLDCLITKIRDRSASPPDSSLIWGSSGHSGWI